MRRALQTRRQRLRRLRELRSGTGAKAAAGGAAILLLLGVVLMCAVAGVVLSTYKGYADDLPPDPSTEFAKQVLGPARIYDRHGTLLYEFEDENQGLRNPVALRDISDWVIRATIATEDASYYDNPGVNVRGLARAGVENFTDLDAGVLQGSGGSSITQQLVKNVFIPLEQRYERSPDRKIKETVFALELTRRYSKDQILEWYLNQIPYGNRTNGIEAASRRYFGINAKDLNLAQAALLAGLPNSPTRYDPFRYPDAAIARQHEVLDLMARHDQITQTEADAAKANRAEDLEFRIERVDLKAPHWVFYVRDQLVAQFGEDTFKSGGLRVTTTLDLPLQEAAERVVRDKIRQYENPPYNCLCHNGALITIDNRTGEILTMVGSTDYWRVDIEGENNNAIAIKQPGSALKPLVYLSAFMKGWNPGTIIYDQPTKWKSIVNGKPQDFIPVGPIGYQNALTARDSLGNSMNTAAVKAAGFVGVSEFLDVAHRLGLNTMDDKENYGVSIATGGSNLTLLDLTYSYSVLANNGEMRGSQALGPKHGVAPNPQHRKLDPAAIIKVENANGEVLYQFDEVNPPREQVVPAGYAYQVTDILKDHIAKRRTYGATAEGQFSIGSGWTVAAKTGTQQGPERIGDVLSTWNFGYTTDLTVGVWVGNQDNKLVSSNLTSASSSLLMWKDFMVEANKMLGLKPREFPVPPDIKWQTVNGKREPVVDGQKIMLCEDLRLWAADNPQYRNASGCSGVRTCDPAPQSSARPASSPSSSVDPCPPATSSPASPGSRIGDAVPGASPAPDAISPGPAIRPINRPTPIPLPTVPPGVVPVTPRPEPQGTTTQPAVTQPVVVPQPVVVTPPVTEPVPQTPPRPIRPTPVPADPSTDEDE